MAIMLIRMSSDLPPSRSHTHKGPYKRPAPTDIALLACVMAIAIAQAPLAQKWADPKVSQPPAAGPQRRTGGESLPLLPLPPAPLPRTECKHPHASPGLNVPTLEGITIEGQLVVIYSSVGLTNGWEQLDYTFNRGYQDADALRIGVNIFAYALTH